MNYANLFIVRHGETDWNVQGRIQGSVDIPLNLKGKAQAHAVGVMLSEVEMHAIYSSPQQRARETAEILQRYHKKKVGIEEALKERSWGEAEGLTHDEFLMRYEKGKKFVPDSETIHALEQRVVPCLKRLSKAHIGQNVLIVAHGWVIKLALILFQNLEDGKFFVANGGWIHMQGDGEILQIVKHQGVEFR